MAWLAVGSLGARRVFAAGPEARLALLKACWPVAVGPGLERRTEVVALERDTLRVRVPDARWRKALHRMQPEILQKLGRIAGELAPRRLGYVEAPPAADPVSHEEAPARVPETACPPAIAEAAAAIPDPELRSRFLASAARYFAVTEGGSKCAKP
jgi:Dna[CI] antecedent DciA-like protein